MYISSQYIYTALFCKCVCIRLYIIHNNINVLDISKYQVNQLFFLRYGYGQDDIFMEKTYTYNHEISVFFAMPSGVIAGKIHVKWVGETTDLAENGLVNLVNLW